jgi:putative ABC transport system permease protein
MKTIRKIILRDLKKSFIQYLALILVAFCGITAFNSMSMSARSFEETLADYYEKYNYFDYFFEAVDIPETVVKSIGDNAQVDKCWVRVNLLVGVNTEQGSNRVLLKMLSLPEQSSDNTQTAQYVNVVKGEYLSSAEKSCMINSKFAKENNLNINDTIEIVINNEIHLFTIDAFADSPEFIYVTATDGPEFVNDRDFGVVYVKESCIQSILSGDTYNQVLVTFSDNDNIQQTVKSIEELLKPYGFVGSTARQDHLSFLMVREDSEILKLLSLVFPFMFLLVSSLICFSMLKQLIEKQMKSIGILQSMGFHSTTIRFNYLLLSVVLALVAAVPAIISGYYLNIFIGNMFNQIYQLENISKLFYMDIAFVSLIICLSAFILTAYIATHRIVKIMPVMSIRGDIDSTAGKKLSSRRKKRKINSFKWSYTLACLLHNKRRSFMTVLGFSVTIMLFICAVSYSDSTNWLLEQYFFLHQKYDYKITLNTNENISETEYLNKIKGIQTAEPALQVYAQIQYGDENQDTILCGLSKENSLIGLYNDNHSKLKFGDGILVCLEYAKKMNINIGDKIKIKVFGENEKEFEVPVDNLVKLSTGFSCFIDREVLCEYLNIENSANISYLQCNNQMKEEMKKDILSYKNVKFIEEKEEAYNVFSEQMMSVIVAIIGIIITFASVMGFVVIFNMTVLNISERQNQYAILKALGVYDNEISNIILRENIILGMLSIIPGIPLGLLMSRFITSSLSSNAYVLEPIIPAYVYEVTLISILAFILLAHAFCMKRIKKVNLALCLSVKD